MDPVLLGSALHRDGIVYLRRILAGPTLQKFRDQISRELAQLRFLSQSGTPHGVSLAQPSSWPRGSARRVIEVIPAGTEKHWDELDVSLKLIGVLDAIIGSNAWEIPKNRRSRGHCDVRQWYCPVVFPEEPGENRAANMVPEEIYHGSGRPGDQEKFGNVWSAEDEAKLHRLRAIDKLSWVNMTHRFKTERTVKDCREKYRPPWTASENTSLLKSLNCNGLRWNQFVAHVFNTRPCTRRQVRERAVKLLSTETVEYLDHKNTALRHFVLECILSYLKSPKQLRKSSNVKRCSRAPIQQKPNVDECGANVRALPSWEPVNRRRARGKGWHIDVGPGFDSDGRRHVFGHPYHGLVMLILISDWNPGGGGTAFLRGSHHWVVKEIVQKGLQGCCQQDLNSRTIQFVTIASARGHLKCIYSNNYGTNNVQSLCSIEQLTGSAGDVTLLHPWLVHTGTTNLSSVPRIMANGMVRINPEVYADRRCVLPATINNCPQKYYNRANYRHKVKACTQFDLLGLGVLFPKNRFRKLQARSKLVAQPTYSQLIITSTVYSIAYRKAARTDGFHVMPSGIPSFNNGKLITKAIRSVNVCCTVSIIVPVHNASLWLDDCLSSIVYQTYHDTVEVSIYDDASDDGSELVIRAWVALLRKHGFSVAFAVGRFCSPMCTGQLLGKETTRIRGYHIAGGIGHCKNMCVNQSAGEFLLFLDADDIMRPTRVELQVALANINPTAIVGGSWKRHPAGSTEHYEKWANSLSDPEGLWLEQFREVTVQMPTWCMKRLVYNAVGGFVESPPNTGEVCMI